MNTQKEALVELDVQSQDPIQEAANEVDQIIQRHLLGSGDDKRAVPATETTDIGKAPEEPAQVAPKNPYGLPRGELAVLRAVSSYPDGASTTLLTLVTGLKARSIQNYLVALSTAGLVERGGGKARCTPKGINGAAPVPSPKTGQALLASSLKTLPPGEANVLRQVYESHPKGIKNKLIAERTGLSIRSVQNYLVNLSTRKLVKRSGGAASISPEVGL